MNVVIPFEVGLKSWLHRKQKQFDTPIFLCYGAFYQLNIIPVKVRRPPGCAAHNGERPVKVRH
jgi:hypothetical protein